MNKTPQEELRSRLGAARAYFTDLQPAAKLLLLWALYPPCFRRVPANTNPGQLSEADVRKLKLYLLSELAEFTFEEMEHDAPGCSVAELAEAILYINRCIDMGDNRIFHIFEQMFEDILPFQYGYLNSMKNPDPSP